MLEVEKFNSVTETWDIVGNAWNFEDADAMVRNHNAYGSNRKLIREYSFEV